MKSKSLGIIFYAAFAFATYAGVAIEDCCHPEGKGLTARAGSGIKFQPLG